jgi:hypothetical protein
MIQEGVPERLMRTTATRMRVKVIKITGRGSGGVLVLDGSLGPFSLAGGAGERVMGARGGSIALLGHGRGLLLNGLGALEGGVAGSSMLAVVLVGVHMGVLCFGGVDVLGFLGESTRGFGIRDECCRRSGGRGGGWRSRPRHAGRGRDPREGCAAGRRVSCATKGRAVGRLGVKGVKP